MRAHGLVFAEQHIRFIASGFAQVAALVRRAQAEFDRMVELSTAGVVLGDGCLDGDHIECRMGRNVECGCPCHTYEVVHG